MSDNIQSPGGTLYFKLIFYCFMCFSNYPVDIPKIIKL